MKAEPFIACVEIKSGDILEITAKDRAHAETVKLALIALENTDIKAVRVYPKRST